MWCCGGSQRVSNLGFLSEDFVDAPQRSGAALEDIYHPTQGDDRPGQLHNISIEGDEIAEIDPAQQNLAPADPQHQDHRKAQQQLKGRPQHSHQAHQQQTAPDIFQVRGLKGGNLCLLLHKGLQNADSGKVLLRACRNIRKHGLDALEALMNFSSEVLDHNAGNRQRQESVNRQPGTDAPHEEQRGRREHNGIRGIHNRRPQQHAHRVQVIRGACHDVAGPGTLVERIRELFQVTE